MRSVQGPGKASWEPRQEMPRPRALTGEWATCHSTQAPFEALIPHDAADAFKDNDKFALHPPLNRQ